MSINQIKAGQAEVEVRANTKKLKGDTKDAESILNNLKKQFGEESALGNIGKLLKGAGAVAGLTVMASTMRDIATSANEWAEKLALGQASVQDMAADMARQIPIVGDLAKAFDEIKTLVTTTAEERKAEAIKQQLAENKLIQDRLAEEQKRRRAPILSQLQSVESEAADAMRLLAVPKDERAMEQARIDRERKIRDAEALLSKASILTPQDQDRLRSAVASMKLAADTELFTKQAEAIEDALKKLSENAEKAAKESADKGKRIDDAVNDFFGAIEDNLQSKANKLKEELQTPVEAFEAKMKEAADLLAAGAINSELYARAVDAATKERKELEEKAMKSTAVETRGLFNAAAIQSLQTADAQGAELRELKELNTSVRRLNDKALPLAFQ